MTDMGTEKVITCHCGGRRAWINGVKMCPHCDLACQAKPGTCVRCMSIGVNLPVQESLRERLKKRWGRVKKK